MDKKPSPPPPKAERIASKTPARNSFGPLLFATLAGAGLGLVLAFGLAAAGLWPVAKPDPIDLSVPALAGLDTRLAGLDARLAGLDARFAELDARSAELETGQQTAAARFASAEDLAALKDQLTALDGAMGVDAEARASLLDLGIRLDNLASATPPQVADLGARLTRLERADRTTSTSPAGQTPVIGADAARLDRLSVDLLALSDRVDQIAGTNAGANTKTNSQIAALEAELAALQSDLTALAARLAILDEPARLARIEAGRQAGFDAIMRLDEKMLAGDTFADELASVTSRLPTLPVPEGLKGRAATGLATASGLRADLIEKMPGILRALASAKTDASLLERFGDQLAAMIALRPDGAPDDNTPLASLARLETALERGEIIAASTEFIALPEAARRAAGEFGAQLAETAAAAEWIAAARTALTASDGALS